MLLQPWQWMMYVYTCFMLPGLRRGATQVYEEEENGCSSGLESNKAEARKEGSCGYHRNNLVTCSLSLSLSLSLSHTHTHTHTHSLSSLHTNTLCCLKYCVLGRLSHEVGWKYQVTSDRHNYIELSYIPCCYSSLGCHCYP